MIKVAFCDDDPLIVELLESYFERLPSSRFLYDEYFTAEELYSYKKKQNYRYELYFFDIEMKGMSGLELARRIRMEEPNALFVFLTSYNKYVYDVFNMITFDFIVKPITFEKFQSVLDRAECYLQKTKKNFQFSYQKVMYCIPCDEIIYIQKFGRSANLYRIDEIYTFNMKTEDIKKQLDERVFVQIDRSCIVNLAYVFKVTNEKIVLKTKDSLFISRVYKKEVKNKYLQFIKEWL